MAVNLVPVMIATAQGRIDGGMGTPIGTELVVHGRSRDHWRITHRPTGTRIATFKSYRSACKGARAIEQYFESVAGVSHVATVVAAVNKAGIMAELKRCKMLF